MSATPGEPPRAGPVRALVRRGDAKADLADLLQTLPADIDEAAGDLAERAFRLTGTPITVAA